jgi:hypothetical protein
MERRRAFAALGVGLALGVVVLHLLQVQHFPAPHLYPDEAGYLGDARDLASGYGRSGAGYFAGYSLFLVPAARFTSTPLRYYHAALVTNAVMSAGSPLLALLLVRALRPRAPRWVALVTAGLVAFAPLAFYYVGLAMSENALLPTTLAIAVLLAHAARRRATSARLGAAAAGAFAYWVSPRGLIVVGATFVALVLLAFDERRSWRTVVPETGLLAVLSLAGRNFSRAVSGTGHTKGYNGLTEGLTNVARHPGNWAPWLGALLGRFAYLGVASAGLTIVGLIVATRWLTSGRAQPGDREHAARRSVAMFALASVAVTAVADAARVTGIAAFDRTDHLYFGRYNEVVALPALVIGASWLLSRRDAARAFRVAAGVGAGIFVARLAVPVLVRRPHHGVVSAAVPAWVPIHRLLHVDTLGAAVLIGAAIATVALLLIAWRPRVFAVVVLLVVALAVAVGQFGDLEASSARSLDRATVVHAIQLLQRYGVPTQCVELDRETVATSENFEYNDRFLLPKTRFLGTYGPPRTGCGPLVLGTGLAYGAHHPAARLVAAETDSDWLLWLDESRLPARTRAAVARAGLAGAPDPCTAMPATAYDARIDATVAATELRVSVHHIGAGAPWLGTPVDLRADRCGQVDVVASVLDAHGHTIDRHTIPLPHSVLPGEAVDLRTALADTPRRGPGDTVHIALVQEGIRSFATVTRALPSTNP